MTAFGIDLGTTNSCVAYLDESGRPVIVKNAIGEETTPSVVYFEKPDEVMVGRSAQDSAVLAPHLVAQLVKREMGQAGRSFTYHKRAFTPEMISAFILRNLAQDTADATGVPVRDVVITVPAYFGVAEREATRRAGQLAGLNVLDLLAEPVAAALSYQDRQAIGRAQHILVFDLGGGTFDTTIVRIDGEEMTVICTGGDHQLGGADWDQRVSAHLLAEFTRRCPGLDPRADDQFMQELMITAESLKRELSSTASRRRNLRFAGAVAPVELTRQQLEQLTADLLARTLTITQRTIEESQRRHVPRLDGIILVGGMTKMPAVKARLREQFGLDIRQHEPDLAVARGAALYAMMVTARQAASGTAGAGPAAGPAAAEDVASMLGISRDQAEAMLSRHVTTVVPRAFGIKVVDQNDPNFADHPFRARTYIVHLLPANTPLPATVGPIRLGTGLDNQPQVDIEVWEQKGPGESEDLADNTYVGRGKLRSLVGLQAGSPIDITFTMTETGLLTVGAAEPGSGREVRFDLQIGGLDQDKIDKAAAMVARHTVSS